MAVLTRVSGIAAAAILAGGEVAAAPFFFKDIYEIDEYLADDLVKPVIADDGSIAFLDVKSFATNERIAVIDADGNLTVLIDSDDPVRPSNLTGPGISDDGVYVAYLGREQGTSTDRVYRQEAGGSPAVLIAGPGSVTDDHPTDPIGIGVCRGNCSVTEKDALIGGSGSVFVSTLNPTTLSFGTGGILQTFATGGAIGLHDEFYQSGQGFKFVVLESDGNERVVASLFSLQNSVEWANTNDYLGGKYETFRSPNITDQLNTAIIAERDLGGQEILAFLGTPGIGSEFSTYATTDGAFATFEELSLGDGKHMAFLATLDTPGSGKALYVGPDAVADRILGPGDKLFNKTVVNVEMAPADAVNASGQIAVAVRFANDTTRIVRISPYSGFFTQAKKALLSTVNLSVTPILSTLIDTPDSAFDLSFDYDFLQQDGLLEVFFGGSLLGSFSSEFDGMALIEGIDPDAIFGSGRPSGALLEFRLSGGPDISLHLDNVSMPGLLNGGFEVGFLEGWRLNPNGGVIAAISTQPPPIVPLPAAGVLIASAFALLGLVRRRRPAL